MLFGAVVGIVPDMDVLVWPLQDDVGRFTAHRSLTHSLLIMLPACVPLSRLCDRVGGLSRRSWFWLLLWCLLTHILLDLCTTYGTQVFWPLSRYPYAWSILFIIDPAYTLVLFGAIALLLAKRGPPCTVACGALLLSTAYILLGAGLKLHAYNVFKTELQSRGHAYPRLIVQNTPFNIVLWQAIATGPDGDIIAWYHLFKGRTAINMELTPAHPLSERIHLRAVLNPRLTRLMEFSKGLYRIEERNADGWLYLTDLRFGVDQLRPFSFRIARLDGREPRLLPSPERQPYRSPDGLTEAWHQLRQQLF